MKRALLLLLVVLTATACGVVPYRDVQRDFERAVQQDNETSVSPFLELSTEGYETVFNELTPEYINGKGPKKRGLQEARLRPNAWMLRSVAAWRLKKYAEATSAADSGLALQPDSATRDAIIMNMIPALTRHSEVMDRWVEAGRAFTQPQYDAQRGNLAKAWKDLSEIQNTAKTDATPKSTRYYVHYQKWRLAQDWAYLITTVKHDPQKTQEDIRKAREAMRVWAKDNALGEEPLVAADSERNEIRSGAGLRKLIEAQGGG